MTKYDWVLLIVMAVFGLGFYFINGESIADRYGWHVIAIPFLCYMVYYLAKRVDELDKRLKRIEQLKLQK